MLFPPALYGFLIRSGRPDTSDFCNVNPNSLATRLTQDHLGYPFAGPHCPSELVCLSTLGQEFVQLSSLLLAQLECRIRRRSLLETLYTACLAPPPHSVNRSLFGKVQRVAIFSTLLLALPGSQVPPLAQSIAS